MRVRQFSLSVDSLPIKRLAYVQELYSPMPLQQSIHFCTSRIRDTIRPYAINNRTDADEYIPKLHVCTAIQ